MKLGTPFPIRARFRSFTWLLAGAWTVCVAGSLLWNLRQRSEQSLRIERRAVQVALENHLVLGHAGLWLVGLAGIGVFRRMVGQEILARDQARAELQREVAERQLAVVQLREANDRYERVLAGAGAGLWDWDVRNHHVVYSPRWKALRGFAEHEVSDSETEWSSGIHPDDAPRVMGAVQAHFAGQTPVFAEEYRARRKDGSWIWIADRGLAWRDAEGRVLRMTGSETDITERKQAEEAVRRSEARWNAAIENFAAGAIIATANEQVIYWNPAAREMHGFTRPDEGLGPLEKTPATFELWTHDGARLLALDEWPMRRIQRGETVRNLELRIRRPDQGWEKVFSYSGAMVETAGGERLIFLSVYDLTGLRQAEAALRESRLAALKLVDDAVAARQQAEQTLVSLRQVQEDLDRAQEVGQIGSWRLDVRRDVLTWSDENHRIFGVPQGTPLSYETFLGIVHPDDRQHVDTQWQAALRGEPYGIDHRLLVDGQVKWVREKAYLEFGAAGELLGAFGITEDITDRKRAEEEIRMLAKFPEQNPNPVLRIARDGVILYANPASAHLLAAWGVRPGDLVSPDWLGRVAAALASGKVAEAEVSCDHRVYSCNLAPIAGQGYVNLYARDVTDRRRAEDALRRAKEDWERTFDAVPDLIAILDREHRVLRANRAMAERLNLTPAQCVGMRCYEVVHGTSQPAESCPHSRSCHDCQEHSIELEGTRLAGQFMVTTSPQFDGQGRVVGTVHVARDISHLKQAEKALQQLNAELEQRVAERTSELAQASAYNRSLIEAAVDPLVTIGPDGKITDVNAATEAATGRTRKELIGTDFSDYFTQPERAREGYQRVFREGSVRDYPLDIRHHAGGTTSVLYNASVYRDETGKVIGVFAAARDITERLRAERALQAERQRLYDLLETLPVYVALLSPDHHVPFANRFFRERFGESHGRRCFEFLFQRADPCQNCETFKALSTHAPGRWEWTGPDGRSYDISDFPFVDTDGSTMILEMGIDITERKKAQEEAQRMREELGHVDRVARLGELTSSLAHELNQPLAAILSNAQAARRLLASDSPDLNLFREILDDIIQDDKRAGSVIHRLRLMLQKGQQEPETFQINDAIREVVQLLHSEAVGRNAALAVDLADGLPTVRAGRVEFQQVMVNLLLNALDAVRGVPSDRREILVQTRTDRETVVVAVRDRGCGLPTEDFNSIFEAFFTTKPSGLGMGLAISRRMIQAHGGRIWAANNDGAGATVAFSLPFRPADKESSNG